MPVYELNHRRPRIDPTVVVDDSATIIGDVIIGAGSSIWPNAVLRGDSGVIRIGRNVNIQDNVVIHAETGKAVVVGDNVSVGHGAILHGCKIGNNVVIGMGSVVMDGASIEDWVIVGAGAVVTQNTFIVSKNVVLGIPGRATGHISDEQREYIEKNAQEYLQLAKEYLETKKRLR
jgi:carbonic anhydrase/acetyltransferase-like protein (isoleucine patch superfamily)